MEGQGKCRPFAKLEIAMKIAIAAIAAFAGVTAIAVPVLAQEHQHGQAEAASGNPALRETGQAAFAAIAEVTARLAGDPATDWSKVKIQALRDHLVDMDQVTLRSQVVATPVPGGARFEVTSADPRVQASIGRMIRMHAGMAGDAGETAAVADIRDGVALTLTGADARTEARIRALGLYGSLTEGAHHQRHHLAIAQGQMQH
jgi:hypothetical protein